MYNYSNTPKQLKSNSNWVLYVEYHYASSIDPNDKGIYPVIAREPLGAEAPFGDISVCVSFDAAVAMYNKYHDTPYTVPGSYAGGQDTAGVVAGLAYMVADGPAIPIDPDDKDALKSIMDLIDDFNGDGIDMLAVKELTSKGYIFDTIKKQIKLVRCNANIKRYISDSHVLDDVRYNMFTNTIMMYKGAGDPPATYREGDWEEMTNADIIAKVTEVEESARLETGPRSPLNAIARFSPSKDIIMDAIQEQAPRIHPVKDYFEHLEWDGTHRIDTLLSDVFGADQNSYTAEAMWIFLLGVISRVYRPGTKFDYMLVLQGPQGSGKSTFFQSLSVLPKYYASLSVDVISDGKMLGECGDGKLIMEYEELDGITKVTAGKLKATITRQDDRFRPAYGRLVESHPRTFIMCGTTNKDTYLSDPTGNRRFLPVYCPDDEAKKLTPEEVDQIWAEAYARYVTGDFRLYLSREADTIGNESRNNATTLKSDDYIDEIEYILVRDQQMSKYDQIKLIDIYDKCCLNQRSQLARMPFEKHADNIIKEALQRLGWKRKRVLLDNGTRNYRYIRPGAQGNEK